MIDLHDRFQRQPRTFALAGIASILILTTLLLSVALRSTAATAIAIFDIDQSSGPDPGVNVREVATHGSVMYGKSVTISAEVREIYSPHAMKIGGSAPIFGSFVLIVSGTPFDTLLDEQLDTDDDIVRVTGIVRPFDLPALERDLEIDLPDDLQDRYDGKSVMVVESISLDPPLAFGPGDKEFPFESDGWDIDVTIGDVVDDTEKYLGETVKVSGEIEEGLLTEHAFHIGDKKLLVITPTPREDLFIEPTAYVIGEVRRFDLKAIEQEFAIDLNDEQLSKHNGNPVVIAETIELVK